MRNWIWVFVFLMTLGTVGYASQEEAKAAYMRGAAAEKSKQYDQAIKEYNAALAADSHYVYAHKGLGNCYYYKGDKSKALKHYDAYLAVMPNDAGIKKFADGMRGSGSSASSGADEEGAGGRSGGRKNVLYTNPISDGLSVLNLGYNRAFGEHGALVVEGAFMSLNLGVTKYTMVGGGLGWHFTSNALEGWFIGPKLQYFSVDATTESTDYTGTVKVSAKGTAIGYGAEFGYQWLWDNGFMLNLGAGGEMLNINVEASATASGGGASASATASGSFSGFIPTALLNMGYAF